ncbi:hypothetical protein [Staphylococcus haemolyticus]|uniref:hypothetical protein n=1 Tax=Staphylococcus haemolyticus TaxID=1283 RepID=UPI001F0A6216|nr:hypothetical protein [Staphylococcus haemolyticus]MCH4424400.1 hypothetical protein [Staphylococcus haemolyticus]
MAEVKLSMEEYHNVVKSLNTLLEKLYEMTKKCSDYKRQRDEIINDMAEVKRKAKAFDEIVKALYKYDSPKDFGDLVWDILVDYGVIDLEE